MRALRVAAAASPADRTRWLLVASGLALSLALAWRCQVGGDQLNLLARGWLFAARGELVPYGNPLSSGGVGVGPATSWLVGLPLALVPHHRAPVALIWLTHLVAYALLDRRLRAAVSPWQRTAFALVYWLNPWRLVASAYLWNPNFLLLVGALHLATLFDQRERASFGASFAHVLALGIGLQLHPAVLLLVGASLALWHRGFVRVHLGGATAGALATLATLVPWLAAVRADPALLAQGEGFLFRSLLLVQPWLKGVALWLRYPSLLLSRDQMPFDFTALLGGPIDRWAAPLAEGLRLVAGSGTFALVLLANAVWLRERFSPGAAAALARYAPPDLRRWVDGYAFWSLAAALVVFAMSPTTPQSWQGLPIHHAAAIPVALWLGGRCEAPATAAGGRRLLRALAVVSLAVGLALAGGGRNFRCGGRAGVGLPLRASSPMFEELGLQRTCAWSFDVPGGWWPDVLPAE